MRFLMIAAIAALMSTSAFAGWCDGIPGGQEGPAVKVDAKACAVAPRTGTVGYVSVGDNQFSRDVRGPARSGPTLYDGRLDRLFPLL